MTEESRRRLDDYDPNEMAIPEWRIIQKTGGDYAKERGANPGQFYNSLTDEIADELNIITVDILSGRARWGAEITSAGPICASQDTKSGKSISGEDCSKCEHRMDNPWSMGASERRQKCCLNYTILGIDLDNDHMPIMVRMHGISALPTRQLITQLRMNRSLKGEYHKAIINVKGIEKDTPYGIAYAMKLKISGLITDEIEANELKAESNRLLGTPIPLLEARPEEEGPEPLGYTPEGKSFFSEEEGESLILAEKAKDEAEKLEIQTPEILQPTEIINEPVEPEVVKEPVRPEARKEPTEPKEEKKDVDIDF